MAHVSPLSRSDLPAFEMIFEGAERALGIVPNSMLTMGRKPGILGAFSLLTGTVFHALNQPFSFKQLKFFRAFMSAAKKPDPENSITPQLQQMVANVCSLSAGCRYCQAHTGESLHLMKVSDEKIQALLHYDTSDEFDEAERAALSLAYAAASVPNQSTPEHFAELRKHFNENQIVELVAVISLFGFLNRWNDTMATALEDAPREFATATLAANGWEVGKHG